ncbi:hypothetical protein PYCC9005_003966 [Savitreella phatthalungensis]
MPQQLDSHVDKACLRALGRYDPGQGWLCGCSRKAARRETRKAGRNKGKWFFTCNAHPKAPEGRRCDFWAWCEDEETQCGETEAIKASLAECRGVEEQAREGERFRLVRELVRQQNGTINGGDLRRIDLQLQSQHDRYFGAPSEFRALESGTRSEAASDSFDSPMALYRPDLQGSALVHASERAHMDDVLSDDTTDDEHTIAPERQRTIMTPPPSKRRRTTSPPRHDLALAATRASKIMLPPVSPLPNDTDVLDSAEVIISSNTSTNERTDALLDRARISALNNADLTRLLLHLYDELDALRRKCKC